MTSTIDSLARAFRAVYDPPVRGLHSKKKRQRKKAEKKYRSTASYILTQPIPGWTKKVKFSDTSIWGVGVIHEFPEQAGCADT